jgi:Txe/YoeB family toxin of Txe-Axe toxin-antitoxin module
MLIVGLFGLLAAGLVSLIACLLFKESVESRLLRRLKSLHEGEWAQLGRPTPLRLITAGRYSRDVYTYHRWVWDGDYRSLKDTETVVLASRLRRSYAVLAAIVAAEVTLACITHWVLSN